MQRNRGLHRSMRGQSCRRLTAGGGTTLPTMRENATGAPVAHDETIGTQQAQEVKTRWRLNVVSKESDTRVVRGL